MSTYQQTPEGKDPALWEIAQRRASFKTHVITYIIVNIFLWFLWYFTGDGISEINGRWNHYPWPVWATVGWGIGLIFHFAGAYIFPKANSAEKEYDKLINKKKSS